MDLGCGIKIIVFFICWIFIQYSTGTIITEMWTSLILHLSKFKATLRGCSSFMGIVSALWLDSRDGCCEPIAYWTVQRDLLHPPFSLTTATLTVHSAGEEMQLFKGVRNIHFITKYLRIYSYWSVYSGDGFECGVVLMNT